MTEGQKKRCYREGKTAYNAGLSSRFNPYRYGTDEHYFWNAGFWSANVINLKDEE